MVSRIKIYFKEMFPLAHLLSGVILAFAFYITLARTTNTELGLTTELVLPGISLMLFIFLIRLMDEFKDYPDDLVNYPDRPLPSGRVKFGDLKVLSAITVLLLFALNLFNLNIAIGAIAVFAYSVLMLKWFFVEEKMRKSLPLALISHHPIVYFYFAYLFIAFTESYGKVPFMAALVCIPLGMGLTNWEISRKIRSPENEDTYTTYSKIWGHRGATSVAIFCQITSLLGIAYYLQYVNAPLWLNSAFCVSYIVTMLLGHGRFMVTLKTYEGQDIKRPLRAFAETQSILVQLAIIVEFFLNK